MPLWDSVQRSLEKASQEAARMAKTQRLRSTADGLARQMNIQSGNIINKTMELFMAGQLTQPELIPLCQELENLRQQFEQVQAELRQMQAAQPQIQEPYAPTLQSPYPPTGGDPAIYPPAIQGGEATEIAPPPPEYQSYLDTTGGALTPPPPPDVASAPGTPITGTGRCPACGSVVQPNHAFCQNCGTPIQGSQQGYQPTVRASNTSMGESNISEEATIRAPEPSGQSAPGNPATSDQINQDQGG